jgi:hypothetical protein
MTKAQIAAQAKAEALLATQSANTPSTPVEDAPARTKLVTLTNAADASEVLEATIAIMKSKVTIKPEQIGRTLIFRVIGNGNMITRTNGDVVFLYNTNATTDALVAKAISSISIDEFLALDLEDAKEEARQILNTCSMSFSANLDAVIQKNDEVKCKAVNFTNKQGDEVLGLNFVGVQQAEVATKGNSSALDALLASFKG